MKHSVVQAFFILVAIHLVTILVAICLFSFFGSEAFGNMERILRQGDAVAAERLGSVVTDKAKAGANPFFHGEGQGPGLDPTISQMLSEDGHRFVIDPAADPLVNSADRIRALPLKVIGGEGTHSVSVHTGGRDEIATCEESGDESVHTCKSHVHVDVREELGDPINGSWNMSGEGAYGYYGMFMQAGPARDAQLAAFISSQRGIPREQIVSTNGTFESLHVNGKFKYCNAGISYSHRPKIKVAYPSWIDGCGHLESKADRGLCTYTSKVCTQGPETRVFDGVRVHQDCWEYTYTYNCSHPSADDCGPLRAKGCVQVRSDCKKNIGAACVVYRQTYQCKTPSKSQTSIAGGDTPFCMDGVCRDQSWENNNEMMQAISQLALLKDMQGRFDGFVFKGGANQCSKNPISFKDCCGNGKGWGISLGLAGCKEEEKALQVKRQKGLCHMVGTYCSKKEKITKICLEKKTSYCCFGSKLLKAFHVQGRPQIGRGWGDGENPDCNGFSVHELQRIDFSRLDLREAFEDLMQNFSPGKIQNVNQQIKDRLDIMKESVKSQDPARIGQSPRQGGAA